MHDWIESSSEDEGQLSPELPSNKKDRNAGMRPTEPQKIYVVPNENPTNTETNDYDRYKNKPYQNQGYNSRRNDYNQGDRNKFSGDNKFGDNKHYNNRDYHNKHQNSQRNDSTADILAKIQTNKKTPTFFLNLYNVNTRTTETDIRNFFKGCEIKNVWVNKDNYKVYDIEVET